MNRFNGKKLVAWGAGPTFELIRLYDNDLRFTGLVDMQSEKFGENHFGVPLISANKINDKLINESFFIITAHSAASIRSIFDELSKRNLKYGVDFVDYSYFSAQRVADKAAKHGFEIRFENFSEIHSSVMISRIDFETTITGVWILESLIQKSYCSDKNAVAEVGAFKCGNAMLQSLRMRAKRDFREYHIFDSFAGFGKLDSCDPQHLANAYSPEMYDYPLTMNLTSLNPKIKINKGFVPDIFKNVASGQQYDLVFFDCDLYQPCLDTFDFFWDRMSRDSFFVFHDYVTYSTGWNGVKKAVDEITVKYGLEITVFWESTMAVIRKK